MATWLGVGLILALLALFVAMVIILVALFRVYRDIQALNRKTTELKSLSLNPRTRIAQASMQSGAVTPEQQGKRLAQASKAKRVVVGGDEDSEQHRRMSRGIRQEENNE